MRYHILAIAALLAASAAARDYKVESPDGSIVVTLSDGESLTWSVTADGDTILSPSRIQMTIDGKVVGPGKVRKVSRQTTDRTIPSPMYKRASVADKYNELDLTLGSKDVLQVRVYNDGAAYRFVTGRKGKVTVDAELAEFRFPGDPKAWVPYVNDNRGGERYSYSFESYYDEQHLSDMYPDSLAITPLLVDMGGCKVAVSDFGVTDYPGMFLKTDGNGGIVAEFAPVPLEGALGGYNELNFIPSRRADYIATDTPGSRAWPWRALVVARDDAELASTDMVVRLSPACAVDDLSWIKPGLVAWDWWNSRHITGVDFKAGINDDTYAYFVDFAADNSIPYIIVDEGWSEENSLVRTRGTLDIQRLADYAASKGVGVILWASWKNMHRELAEAMDKYAGMGIAGFKIDFFDADDQQMVRDMELFAREAAARHLVLDYHGMKANGMQVTYPNILNFEGVKGLENYKWSSAETNPTRYALTIPYIRAMVGPMDYTPGAMLNVSAARHRADNDNPMSVGTRVQQLAMYIVYDAPLQMMADSPVRYKASQDCLDFITSVPTVFDETRVLSGKVGEYIVVARRAGYDWYLAAMCAGIGRQIEVPLDFLSDGPYVIDSASDGVNVDIDATDHRHSHAVVTADTELTIDLAADGGYAAILKPMAR